MAILNIWRSLKDMSSLISTSLNDVSGISGIIWYISVSPYFGRGGVRSPPKYDPGASQFIGRIRHGPGIELVIVVYCPPKEAIRSSSLKDSLPFLLPTLPFPPPTRFSPNSAVC
jgi:hypothetical protein